MIHKLKLTSTQRSFYFRSDVDNLKSLGFKFKKFGNDYEIIQKEPTIEFNSMDEFMEFINKVGRCVVEKDTIEIYNTYRE